MKKSYWVFIGLFSFLCSTAFGDSIHLTNGETIKGEIIDKNEKTITVKTSWGKAIIDVEKISKIEKESDKDEIDKGDWKKDLIKGLNLKSTGLTKTKVILKEGVSFEIENINIVSGTKLKQRPYYAEEETQDACIQSWEYFDYFNSNIDAKYLVIKYKLKNAGSKPITYYPTHKIGKREKDIFEGWSRKCFQRRVMVGGAVLGKEKGDKILLCQTKLYKFDDNNEIGNIQLKDKEDSIEDFIVFSLPQKTNLIEGEFFIWFDILTLLSKSNLRYVYISFPVKKNIVKPTDITMGSSVLDKKSALARRGKLTLPKYMEISVSAHNWDEDKSDDGIEYAFALIDKNGNATKADGKLKITMLHGGKVILIWKLDIQLKNFTEVPSKEFGTGSLLPKQPFCIGRAEWQGKGEGSFDVIIEFTDTLTLKTYKAEDSIWIEK